MVYIDEVSVTSVSQDLSDISDYTHLNFQTYTSLNLMSHLTLEFPTIG
jgi:hypothetical protein